MLLHIGLPKTGTTYLQQVVWGNRDRLESDGVFVPGFGHREHLWAALDLLTIAVLVTGLKLWWKRAGSDRTRIRDLHRARGLAGAH